MLLSKVVKIIIDVAFVTLVFYTGAAYGASGEYAVSVLSIYTLLTELFDIRRSYGYKDQRYTSVDR